MAFTFKKDKELIKVKPDRMESYCNRITNRHRERIAMDMKKLWEGNIQSFSAYLWEICDYLDSLTPKEIESLLNEL